MNNDLKNDLNNALNSDQFISLVINFINNASVYFYDDSYNKSYMIEASNVRAFSFRTFLLNQEKLV